GKADSQNAEIQSNKAKEQNFNVDSSSSGTSMFGKRILKTPFLYSSNNAENHQQEQAASMDNLAASLNKANSENYNLQDDQASTKMVNKRGIYLE
ncbi:17531_t:CDS:1, partial [Acaulospora morrowiae]